MSDVIVICTGNLGRVPERRYTTSGKAVISGSMGVQVGANETDWYDLTVWHDDAPGVGGELERLETGRRVDVVGRLKMRTWTDKEGRERVTPSITVDRIRAWPPKRDDGGQSGGGDRSRSTGGGSW